VLKPGADHLLDLAATALPRAARVLDLTGAPVVSPRLAARRVTLAKDEEAVALLRAHASDPFDAILAAWPSRAGALMQVLDAMRDALAPEGTAIVCDLVWQTAPSVELLRAFNLPGREKVRPIEGYEMQLEHSGFDIVERGEVDRARWVGALADDARAAVQADTRGAARLAVWTLRRASDEEARSDEA
jgi:hypothetical protein